jgi:catechol 2,3-dioxygenase-like lactoylglutathione lyase family enzyme
MIKNIRHTGIVVHDIRKMSAFYQLLGFIVEDSAVESGAFIEQVVNISDVKVEWIKMRSPDGYLLELLQYHTHPKKLIVDRLTSNDLGCSHLAFTVDSIDEACEKIKKAGGFSGNSPAIAPNGKVKVAYCQDPEGVLLEIVEEL